MIRLEQEIFLLSDPSLSAQFVLQLNRMFERLYARSHTIPFAVRDFVDASSAAQSRYLPPIATNSDKDYFFVKTDSSVNTVTIYPAGTDTIVGAASFVLAAQYDKVLLVPNNGVWYVQ